MSTVLIYLFYAFVLLLVTAAFVYLWKTRPQPEEGAQGEEGTGGGEEGVGGAEDSRGS